MSTGVKQRGKKRLFPVEPCRAPQVPLLDMTIKHLEASIEESEVQQSTDNSVFFNNLLLAIGAIVMAGLSRIEIKQKKRLEDNERNISEAFQDLGQLMVMAQTMTKLSKSIAAKLKEHGSQVTNDETIQFKSRLMELGIQHQIDVGLPSKSSYSCNSDYYRDLARQIASIVRPFMNDRKQEQLTLSDVYCCFNRARGMDLVSPDDILNACEQLERMPELQLEMFKYTSGLLVIQNRSCDNEELLKATVDHVDRAGSLTPLQLSARLMVSVQLARQRLEEAESVGRLCRDESLEGLKFYPNKFLSQA